MTALSSQSTMNLFAIYFSSASLLVSILSILLAGIVGWFGTWRKPKVIGVFSGMTFEKRNSPHSQNIKITGDVVPLFILKNVGARPAIIEDIRIGFLLNTKRFFRKPCFFAEPFSDSMEQKIEETFVGLILPFDGFWKNTLKFKMSMELFDNAKNKDINVFLEIKLIKQHWIKVKTNKTIVQFSEKELSEEKQQNFYSDIFCSDIFKSFKLPSILGKK